jgi:hypothetical protein
LIVYLYSVTTSPRRLTSTSFPTALSHNHTQALSLPITNIAFTLKPLMGDDAEPLTLTDLMGLVLVCIGFLAYSGFGFASNFMVAQVSDGSYLQ